jgi:BON domain
MDRTSHVGNVTPASPATHFIADPRPAKALCAAACATVLVALATPTEAAEPTDRRNWFDDPFVQVTAGLPACPVPEGPLLAQAQMQREAHDRAERGTSCYMAGRCRLPNAYLYDKEIAPRVVKSILADGRFADTSVWIEGKRRWVWLKGCVTHAQQKQALEERVRGIDDVEAVINELQVGTRATPPYRTAAPR